MQWFRAVVPRRARPPSRGTPPAVVHSLAFKAHMKRFRGGLVFKAHSLLYLSTLGLKVMKERRRGSGEDHVEEEAARQHASTGRERTRERERERERQREKERENVGVEAGCLRSTKAHFHRERERVCERERERINCASFFVG